MLAWGVLTAAPPRPSIICTISPEWVIFCVSIISLLQEESHLYFSTSTQHYTHSQTDGGWHVIGKETALGNKAVLLQRETARCSPSSWMAQDWAWSLLVPLQTWLHDLLLKCLKCAAHYHCSISPHISLASLWILEALEL